MSAIFNVEKMTCGGCARHVTKTIEKAAPGSKVDVDRPSGKVTVEPAPADLAAIARAISDAGYPARVGG